MRPKRAAWFFLVGVAWIVLRGILGRSVPGLDPARIAEAGGGWLVLPLLSVAASLTIPLFFLSFLRHHGFAGQQPLRAATWFAAAASTASFALVGMSFLGLLGGELSSITRSIAALPWLLEVVPLLLLLSLVTFLGIFAWRGRCPAGLRRAAAAAAVGAVVPVVLMVGWMVRTRTPEAVQWWSDGAGSMLARIAGLAGAATLVWFLESFAVGYGSGPSDDEAGAF